MLFSVLGPVLLSQAVDGLRVDRETPTACLNDCALKINGILPETGMKGVCNDVVKQKNLFLCLLRTCLPQHYGPALAYTISSCSVLGSNVTPLYPVEVKGPESTWKQFATANKLNFRSLFSSSTGNDLLDQDSSTGLACTTGQDGVVTLSATSLSIEPSSLPNHADLPGGHRGPMNPEQQSQINQMASERPHQPTALCTSCTPSAVLTKSGSVSSNDDSAQAMTEGPLSMISMATQTVSGAQVVESAVTVVPSKHKTGSLPRHDCTTSATSNPAGAEAATRCKCSSTRNKISLSTSTPCTKTPDSVIPTTSTISPTASPCSGSRASVVRTKTHTPVMSSLEPVSESMLSTTTSASQSESCDSSLSGLTSSEISASDSYTRASTWSKQSRQTTSPSGHFPQKPSRSSCQFVNTTTTVGQTRSSTSLTHSFAEMSSTTCTTTLEASARSLITSVASPIFKSLPCTTSKASQPSPETSSVLHSRPSTVVSLLPSSPPSHNLAEYQTPALPQAYSELNLLSLPAYGHLPEYGSVLSEAASHSKASHKTSFLHSSSIAFQTRQASTLPVYAGQPPFKTKGLNPQPATEGLRTKPSMTSSEAHQPEDASSFLSDTTGETLNDQANLSNHDDEQNTATAKSETTMANHPDPGPATLTRPTVQSKRPSALFVTIIAPDEQGQLETSIMTVEEISPWATMAPRKEQKHQRQLLSDDVNNPVFSREQHAEGITITSTIRATIIATASNTLEEFNDSSTLHNASHIMPPATVLSSIVTAVSSRIHMEWEWTNILAIQAIFIFMIL